MVDRIRFYDDEEEIKQDFGPFVHYSRYKFVLDEGRKIPTFVIQDKDINRLSSLTEGSEGIEWKIIGGIGESNDNSNKKFFLKLKITFSELGIDDVDIPLCINDLFDFFKELYLRNKLGLVGSIKENGYFSMDLPNEVINAIKILKERIGKIGSLRPSGYHF